MDELISREAVKEMMKNHRVDFSTEKDYRTARACANAVLPAEPMVGKWKNIIDGIEYTWGTCGTCGARIPMPYKYYKYCPHCGMKNEVEHG